MSDDLTHYMEATARLKRERDEALQQRDACRVAQQEAARQRDVMRKALEDVRNSLLARSYQGSYVSDQAINNIIDNALSEERENHD